MKIAVTGAPGFLGWHLSCRARALYGVSPQRISREHFADPRTLAAAIGEADTVVHLAGVNRAATDQEVEAGNVELAQRLGEALDVLEQPIHVVFGNSIQAELDNAYGRGKAKAADTLARAVARHGGTLTDVLLPNIFGEHGRPHYNSFVATFCHELANGRRPDVHEDSCVPLVHAQAAADILLRARESAGSRRCRPEGEQHSVAEIAETLTHMRQLYDHGEIPDLSNAFCLDLFNTYRSHLPTDSYRHRVTVHRDPRGSLFELARSHGGTSQVYASTTGPGQRRGDHYHLHKVERFQVVSGTAEIALRRLYGDEVIRVTVTGDEPVFVDMPTMWTHNITNTGPGELVTLFWSNQLLDPSSPDQYTELVEPLEEAAT